MAALHLLNRVVELFLELLSLDGSLPLLLVLLVDQFLLQGLTLVHLLLKPRLLLDNKLLLAFLQILLMLHFFLPCEFFTQGVRLRVFALLHQTLEHLFILQ